MEKALVFVLLLNVICDSLGVSVSRELVQGCTPWLM